MLKFRISPQARLFLQTLLLVLCVFTLVACGGGPLEKSNIDITDPALKEKAPSSQKLLEELAREQEKSKDIIVEDNFEWPEEALVVCLESTNQIGIVDLKAEKLIGKITVGSGPRNIIKSQDSQKVFVSNAVSGEVSVIDVVKDRNLTIPMGSSPLKMVMSPDDRYLYVVDYFLNGVRVVDTELFSLVKVLGMNNMGYAGRVLPMDCCLDPFASLVDFGRGPTTLAIDAAGETLYVGNIGTYDIGVVDIKAGWESVSWDGVVGVRDVLIAGSPAKLYMAAVGSSQIYSDKIAVFNIETGDLENEIEIGHEPIALALSPSGDIIYGLARDEQKLVEIDVSSGQILRRLEIDEGARAMTLSDDGRMIYISHEVQGKVSIISVDDFKKISSIPVGIKPYGLVYLKQELE